MPSSKAPACRNCPVWKQSLYADLSEAQLSELEKSKSHRRVKRGEAVFKQGEEVDGIFCVHSGVFKVVQNDQYLQEKAIRLVGPGGSAGHRSLFTQAKYRGSCVAKDSGAVCRIPQEAVHRALGSNVDFVRRLVSMIAQDLSAAEKELRAMKELSVTERVARLVLKLKKEFGGENAAGEWEVSVPLTKVEMASMVSTSEETVVRVFNKFKKDGALRFEGKRMIVVHPQRLQDFTDSKE